MASKIQLLALFLLIGLIQSIQCRASRVSREAEGESEMNDPENNDDDEGEGDSGDDDDEGSSGGNDDEGHAGGNDDDDEDDSGGNDDEGDSGVNNDDDKSGSNEKKHKKTSVDNWMNVMQNVFKVDPSAWIKGFLSNEDDD